MFLVVGRRLEDGCKKGEVEKWKEKLLIENPN